MFLNETKPPLDEALAHFGILGMRWGHHKNDQNFENYNDNGEPKKNHTGLKIAAAVGLTAVGAAFAVTMLSKNGSVPVSSFKIPKSRKSPFAGRSFRPEHVGNPLWTVDPKKAKAAKDFVDAGFGKNGVFNVTTMNRGAKTVNDFGSNVWDVPMLAITSGRK